MANPRISITPGVVFVWVADVATIADSQSYHKHVFGFRANTGTITLQWSEDGTNWFDVEPGRTTTTGSFFLDQVVPNLRITRTAAGEGTVYHYNTMASGRV